jgi:hypothetical protein
VRAKRRGNSGRRRTSAKAARGTGRRGGLDGRFSGLRGQTDRARWACDMESSARGLHRGPLLAPRGRSVPLLQHRRPIGRPAEAGIRWHQGGAQGCALPSPWAQGPSKRGGSSGSGELPGLRPAAGQRECPAKLVSVTEAGEAKGVRSVRRARGPHRSSLIPAALRAGTALRPTWRWAPAPKQAAGPQSAPECIGKVRSCQCPAPDRSPGRF